MQRPHDGRLLRLYAAHTLALALVDCTSPILFAGADQAGSDGPHVAHNPNPHRRGNATAGRDVFRFETFGNEGFWTDAL